MAAPCKDFVSFSLPADLDDVLSLDDQNVCVVSIFGKTATSDAACAIINQTVQRQSCGKNSRKVSDVLCSDSLIITFT
jgi:hypothetical protein